MGSTGGDGYFPRGRSVLRAVMDERVVGLLYGQRVVATLPARVREEFGLPWTRGHRLAHQGLRTSLRRGRRLVPGAVATGATLPVGGPLLRSLEPRNQPRIRRALARHS